MADKNQVFSINFAELLSQLKTQREELSSQDNSTFGVRTSVFTVGKDPRVFQERSTSPELTFIEILRDGLNNYYTQINWRIKKADVDAGNIVAFNVYRKQVVVNTNSVSITKPTQNTTRLDANGLDKLSQILQARWWN